MIPRYQRILFWILLGSSIVMVIALIWLHRRAHATINADNTPLAAPSSSGTESVPFAVVNDDDGTITSTDRDVALPSTPAIRARALLEKLLADYALPGSSHPIPGGIAVNDVFLVDLPLSAPASSAEDRPIRPALTKEEAADPLTHGTGQLAVVNLRSSWIENHPSGIQTEQLTLLSILGTLHTNLPTITQVRFLVDGLPRPTLAGHVNLTRTYACIDTT